MDLERGNGEKTRKSSWDHFGIQWEGFKFKLMNDMIVILFSAFQCGNET